jgi:hypothetical protein
MGEQKLLTVQELEGVRQELLPMPVLSDNIRSFFSWGIKAHEHGCYNHFMWMIHPGVLASQNFLYQSQSVKDYTKDCRLKLWYCKSWTPENRNTVIKLIEDRLNLPWYKRLYDVPAILGQLTWKEIQVPYLRICSDYGEYIKSADPEYDLHHPDPENVNKWLEQRNDCYEVYGRYVPD